MKFSFRYFFILTLIAGFGACESKKEAVQEQSKSGIKFSIKGMVKRTPFITLYELVGDTMKPIDSARPDGDGNFTFSGNIPEPGFYVVDFFGTQQKVLALDSTELEIEADGLSNKGLFKASGGKAQRWYERIDRFPVETAEGLQVLQAANKSDGSLKSEKELITKMISYELSRESQMKKMIDSLGTSFLALYAANYFDKPSHLPYLDSLLKKFKEQKPKSKYTREFIQTMNQRGVNAGAVAPAISMPDAHSKMINLSDFKGKYVLVDFWAGWCPDCREDNPRLVELYQSLKGKNIEFLGVSLDQSKEVWQKAIEKDGLTWPQVTDLAKWKTLAARAYQVNEIPTTFLIDPQGRVVLRNPTSDQVKAIVQK